MDFQKILLNIAQNAQNKKGYIMYKESFPSRLKMARKQTGLTQREVAKELNLSIPNISRYETGAIEPNLEWLAKFALFYGVTVDWLISLEKHPNKINPMEPVYKEQEIKKSPAATFALRIKKARYDKKLSQSQLAKITKIPPSTIAKYEIEQLEPTIERLAILAIELEISADWLLGIDKQPDSS
ncbi:MAG: transcriptional regulator [Syntrophomonadaceae bacterium]|jgi:transcriptional regulator with XRE-family HTH domain|nr:transcriptional regulator [Syntrophomonadaceae bacterium]